MTTPEALRRAAGYIEEHGLSGDFGEDGGPRCVYGTFSSFGHHDTGWRFRRFIHALGLGYPVDLADRHAGSPEGAAWVAGLMRACAEQS